MKHKFSPKVFLEQLTNHPGVYQMLGENGEVLYVGKALNLKKRLSSYFKASPKDIKTQRLVKHIADINVTITRNENEALLLECNLIKKHKPRYNVLFRDDKSYPYILITNDHPFARIDFFRGQKKGEGRYFGPYPSAAAVRETIHLIQKLFKLRGCTDSFYEKRTRPCLQHQIGRCTGPCVGLINIAEYQENVQHAILFLQGKSQQIINELTQKMETASREKYYELAARYRDQVTSLRKIQERQYISSQFEGDVDIIGFANSAGVACIQLLTMRGGRMLGSRTHFPNMPANANEQEIISSFITQHYLVSLERAYEIPREIIYSTTLSDRTWLGNALSELSKHKVVLSEQVRGDRKKWLETAMISAKQSLATHLTHQSNLKARFAALRELLQLKKIPQRIECFDVSHSMGEATVASCVVFNPQGPVKSDYRRFNISGIIPGDDVAAMKQVILRRYKRIQENHAKLPEIILIDGGKTQLNAAQQMLQELKIENVILIGVAKGVSRKPGFETLHRLDHEPIHLPADSLALHLIQQIRDEAHRFAITGHRQRRDKKRHTSMLESIAGVGAKRRRELLRYFGGIQALKHASLEEIEKVPGISHSLAIKIFENLHDVTIE